MDFLIYTPAKVKFCYNVRILDYGTATKGYLRMSWSLPYKWENAVFG